MGAFYTHSPALGKPALIWPERRAKFRAVILEDPYVGLAVLAALIACVAVAQFVLPPLLVQRKTPPLAPVLQALSDLDDEEMLVMGRKLGRLPARDRRVSAAAQPLAAALLEWRATFDDAARREFLELASALVSGVERTRSA